MDKLHDIDFQYIDQDGNEIMKQIAYRANALGLTNQQITDVRILKKFGEGIKIRFKTMEKIHIV